MMTSRRLPQFFLCWIVALFGFVFSLSACPGPTFIVQQYGGAIRSQDTIAILRVNGADSVRLLTLDNEDVAAPIESDGRLHIEMLPARHTVTVANAKAPNERYAPLTWQAEANKVYRVVFAPGTASWEATTARMFEVDRSKDVAIRDVTIIAAAPEAPKPPPPPPTPAPEAEPQAADAGGSL